MTFLQTTDNVLSPVCSSLDASNRIFFKRNVTFDRINHVFLPQVLHQEAAWGVQLVEGSPYNHRFLLQQVGVKHNLNRKLFMDKNSCKLIFVTAGFQVAVCNSQFQVSVINILSPYLAKIDHKIEIFMLKLEETENFMLFGLFGCELRGFKYLVFCIHLIATCCCRESFPCV